MAADSRYPLFIALEGIDGCGKTTQVTLLQKFLQQRGREVVVVHNPGTTPLAAKLRTLLLHDDLEITPEEQALLFTAARSSVRRNIAKHLSQGRDVICDRWLASTCVYQGAVLNVGVDRVRDLHTQFVGLNPDFTIIIDVPASEARRRLQQANRSDSNLQDRFESKGLEFAEQLRRYYRLVGESDPQSCIVDGHNPPDEVAAAIVAAGIRQSEKFSHVAT